MSEERKYSDEEIKEIFGRAVTGSEIEPHAESEASGLTLRELQEVGREVGLAPGRVAAAALALDNAHEVATPRTIMGAPVSAGRSIALSRALTDREWGVLVGELRETFGAKGRVTSDGGVREWTNGNLHAYVEPTATGYRLRIGTQKGNAIPQFLMGGAAMTLGVVLTTLFFFEDLGRAALVLPVLMTFFGGTAVASNLLRLSTWAGRRQAQMAHVGETVTALIGATPQGP